MKTVKANETYYPDMETLIYEARAREIAPSDIFKANSYDYLIDAKEFFNDITKGKDDGYAERAGARILKNKAGDQMYDVLLAWLSDGEVREKDKLSPAGVKFVGTDRKWVNTIDGRHRAQLCIMLDIDLPVEIIDG